MRLRPMMGIGIGLFLAASAIVAWAGGLFTMSETPLFRGLSAPPPESSEAIPGRLEKATFGSGCFWCSEAVFQQLKGVHSVVSGYSGGQVQNPTYNQVCTGATGHAEVVQITYDPGLIS